MIRACGINDHEANISSTYVGMSMPDQTFRKLIIFRKKSILSVDISHVVSIQISIYWRLNRIENWLV